MTDSERAPGIVAGRLTPEIYARNFAELTPPLTAHEALVAADRCYFCHDAPCIDACPTGIDVPMFIRQISTGAVEAAARTILERNILGGMCARACPTEQLCEQACVRETAEGHPVSIGRLQRFATDAMMRSVHHPFERQPISGKRVAVIGAGPAGLACAHELARLGHDVEIFEMRSKAGGLNEFGIATYKTVDDFAARELAWLLAIGGITMRHNSPVQDSDELAALQRSHDAVFVGVGLAGVNPLATRIVGQPVIQDAVAFIAELRQIPDPSLVPIGRDVVIIGGGMTAVDAAIQSRLLGAETVSIVYRNGRERMGASRLEQDHATSQGVRILCGAKPTLIASGDGHGEIEFERVDGPGSFRLEADQILLAIGQTLSGAPDGLRLVGGRIWTDDHHRTSLPGIWAGGDCVANGDNLTVTAVAQGRDAARDIDRCLTPQDAEPQARRPRHGRIA